MPSTARIKPLARAPQLESVGSWCPADISPRWGFFVARCTYSQGVALGWVIQAPWAFARSQAPAGNEYCVGAHSEATPADMITYGQK